MASNKERKIGIVCVFASALCARDLWVNLSYLLSIIVYSFACFLALNILLAFIIYCFFLFQFGSSVTLRTFVLKLIMFTCASQATVQVMRPSFLRCVALAATLLLLVSLGEAKIVVSSKSKKMTTDESWITAKWDCVVCTSIAGLLSQLKQLHGVTAADALKMFCDFFLFGTLFCVILPVFCFAVLCLLSTPTRPRTLFARP
ncbi:GPI inositol deacylase precursor [Trypanosoma rangeli]|uniref:GPI inositol deacylase n=1 Tax=Trypanosoma rangeli TaxID=5698 RepID=A0A422P2F8_TRYRA|nr:GPI inositol deacylase precursor [Trypanosoma rangeli]RNF11855.1 GPI inositol deacylase precursor [Trypanosoma rangeli]|eukprot:RNF11855.1 GPI inositol deacylase precursor [Trypanosoma rangeli]